MLCALLISICGIVYVLRVCMLPRMCTKLVKVLLLQYSVAICEKRILRKYTV